jgi:mevalonate kinase
MDHQNDVESTLNALLLNASQLHAADEVTSARLSDDQERLIDNLFNQWNRLSEDEKRSLLATEVETKVLELARKNRACLKEVGARISHKSSRTHAEQLDLNL